MTPDPAQEPAPTPRLELPALLATNAFTADDLACNRRGELSPTQHEWMLAHPAFRTDANGTVETLLGRALVVGKYREGSMGETTFATLALPGRRLRVDRRVAPLLVRGAPYRAYVAYGWLLSIEPISDEDLRAAAAAGGIVPYRLRADSSGDAAIHRGLARALARELAFTDADLEINDAGGISTLQRAAAWKLVTRGAARVAVACAVGGAFGWMLSGMTSGFPVLIVVAYVGLFLFLTSGLATLWKGIGPAFGRGIASTRARIGRGANAEGEIVLAGDGGTFTVHRAAVTIAEAPFATIARWEFQVYFAPRTRAVLSVRPIGPVA